MSELKLFQKIADVISMNRVRRDGSNFNWKMHKASLIERLEGYAEILNHKGVEVAVYNKQKHTGSFIEGVEYIEFSFIIQETGLINHSDKDSDVDYEKGAGFSICHSSTGNETIFLRPAVSHNLYAKHKSLIAYYNENGCLISDATLQRILRQSFEYYMYTSILHKNTPFLRVKIELYKIISFWYLFKNSEEQLKVTTGIYIPLITFLLGMLF